jgi:hypothetical protein
LVVGAMLVAGIAAVYVTSRPTTDPLSVGCYRTLDQNADIAILPLAGSEVKPAERCAAEWRSAFGVDVPPELITCVVRDGGLGIFPGKEGLDAETTCAAIGASTPRSGTYGGKTASEVRAWAGDVESAYIQASKKRDDCLSEAVLAALIRESFDRWDFETWTVSRVESDGDLRCASYSVDSVNAVVILVEDH